MDNEQSSFDSSNEEKEKINLSSKKKWFWLAVAVALISPISGVVLAVAFLTEKDLKKQGRIILPLAIVWGVIFLYLTDWLVSQGYLPT